LCLRTASQWQNPIFPASKHVFFLGSRHCASVLQTQVQKLCTDLNLRLLYILIFGTYDKFARENHFLALGVCFPQPCSGAGRRFAASRSRLQNYRRIVLFLEHKIDEMRCKLDSTENPRSFEKYPTPPFHDESRSEPDSKQKTET
jgi:hypothetical protein